MKLQNPTNIILPAFTSFGLFLCVGRWLSSNLADTFFRISNHSENLSGIWKLGRVTHDSSHLQKKEDRIWRQLHKKKQFHKFNIFWFLSVIIKVEKTQICSKFYFFKQFLLSGSSHQTPSSVWIYKSCFIREICCLLWSLH